MDAIRRPTRLRRPAIDAYEPAQSGGGGRGSMMGAPVSATAERGLSNGTRDDAGVRRAIVVVVGAVAMCWPAFYNGYPLLYPDTEGYLLMAETGTKFWARSIYYGYVIYPLHLETSLWPVVFGQSLIAVDLAARSMRVVTGARSPALLLLVVVALALFSSLPWYTSFVMPDIFTAYLVICLFLLGFGGTRLDRVERLYLFVLAVLSVAVHQGNVPLGIAVAATVALVGAIAYGWRNAVRVALLPLIASAVGAAAVIGANVVYHGIERAGGYGVIFAFARLQSDGIVVPYLRETCGERNFAICPYIDELGDDHSSFLWSGDSPLRRLGDVESWVDEADEIVRGAVAARPWATVKAMVRNAGALLLTPHAHDFYGFAIGTPNGWMLERMGEYIPAERGAMIDARQHREALGRYQPNRIVPAAVRAARVGSGVMVIPRWRWRAWPPLGFMTTVAAAILCNAIVTGAVSGSALRYQARMAWLVPLAAALALIWLHAHRKKATARTDSPGRP